MTPAEILRQIQDAQNCAIPGCRCAKPGMTHCPSHADQRPSLSLALKARQVLVHCLAGCDQDAVISALRERGLWPPAENAARFINPKRQIVKTYDYHGPAGGLVFQVVRYEPKDFRQRRPDGNGGWIWNMDGVKPILYRLPEILAAPADQPMFVVEGEKDVETAEDLGLFATCTPMGAGKAHLCDLTPLRNRRVVIIEDADEAGRKHAEDLARALGNVTRVRFNEKDLTDLVAAYETMGASREELLDFIEASITPPPREPSLAPLDHVEAFLSRFVSYPSEHARVAHTLWIAHAHLMDAWESTPRIAFLSPEPASGKSRALEVSELLVPRPVEAVNVTAAYLFRKVGAEQGRPTILYDEIDTVFGPKAKENEEIRGLLNAGHRRGAVAGRCIVKGKTVVTEEIPAYCAVALAGLGGLPDTILSRCVVVRMRRRAPDEVIEPFRRRDAEHDGVGIRALLERWAAMVAGEIAHARPYMPNGIEDRNADVWEALLAVADAVGGEWPQVARAAAVALVAESQESTPSLGVRLLQDIKTAFGEEEALATRDLLETLNGMEEAPWGDLRGGALNARGIAQRLRPYGVGSKKIRIGDATAQGYRRADFSDAWKRYLPRNVPDVPHVPHPYGGEPRDLGGVREAVGTPPSVGTPPYRNGTSRTNGTELEDEELPDYVSGLPI
jgi:5S rRNA maturation endonuclease (ribonuclease M5)